MGNVFGSSSPALPDGISEEQMDRLREHLSECPNDSCLNLDTNRFNLLTQLDKKKAKRVIHVSKDGKFFSQYPDRVIYLSWLIQQPISSNQTNNKGKMDKDETIKVESPGKSAKTTNISKDTATKEVDHLTDQFVQLTLDNDTRPSIPNKVRNQVWRNHTGGSMDGTCYCCRKPIKLDNNGINEDNTIKQGDIDYRWECGHILSYRNGGMDAPINLRPLCFSCNRSMSHKHMILYMIENKTKGLKHASTDLVLLYQFLIDHYDQVVKWQTRQEQQLKAGQITIEHFRHDQRIMYYAIRADDKTRLNMLSSIT